MNRHLIYILLLCFLQPLRAQEALVASADSLLKEASADCTISGRVLDEEQKPLPFVTVKASGQAAGSVTSLSGQYSFDFQTGDTVVITYSLIGYEKKEKLLVRPRGKLT